MSGFTVITTMKNEGAFVLEWVAHHKALGFDQILICTNDCADHTRRMAMRLHALGLAVHHPTKPWAATSIQRSALKQATRHDIVRQADWIWVCDADEFLTIRLGDGSVQALAAAATPQAEVIPVPWRIFGPDGRHTYEDQPVTQQFHRSESADGPGYAYAKSLFRGLANVGRIGIHAPIARTDLGRDLRREEAGGRPWRAQPHTMFVAADYSVAQVNHYALRSTESFLVKRDRGRVNHVGQDMGRDYWDRFNLAKQPCDAIRRYDDRVQDWMARMMADPDLAFMHKKSVAWHRARIAALRAEPHHAALWAQLTGPQTP
ncbi:MAG: glycosyltransferase family 2 protein [Pseudotabrizicola sp.]|uniref:glycosyltransferase family 2 protein n=1 Tax=Pseudotabrizicola sp. TaxID=2939647 RepID=UPI002724DD85|nr:glycosyltransferase family 2 protein [Pseudotabrizicola sp.]MDO8883439.1 glycosyltransferase family 2 protein [Pseudotabrizicola sp.]MDP2079800.1 glycosyltransferase family 2 protein [Pseudotabrizicola sp.]MDZ7574801.1 glycosyltransferase family 2 protein [Pseudotabrizicola sp.]